MSEAIKKVLRRWDGLYQGLSFLHVWSVNGRKEALRRYREHQEEKRILAEMNQRNTLSAEERARQEKETFPAEISFSILVPLYNTPERFLREMLDSVEAQTFRRWELCLADGSDDTHREVERICRERADADSRIRYRKLEKNGGISENTNACLDMAKGNYIALFDHDDLLHPSALYEMARAIRDTGADFLYSDENTFHQSPRDAFQPHFKPDFAPDSLRGINYICHLTVFRKDLLEKAGGGFRKEYDGSQDYDLILRLTEQAEKIVHVPKILYYWRAHEASTASNAGAKPYVAAAARKALAAHLARIGLEGEVLDAAMPTVYRIRYRIQGTPMISILIPSKDHREDLRRCVESILQKSTWAHYEIIIIENNSNEPETFAYYETLKDHPRIRVIVWEREFNYSAINNFGAEAAKGDYLLLLNNDTEVISPDWMQEMLMFAQRSDVGAVGAKLYYPDHTIQHAGIGIGIMHLAGHYHRHFPGDHPGYMSRLSYAQNMSAVTAACMLVPRKVYEEMRGLDEGYSVVFNDVDFCLRIRRAGYLIVWTPFAELTHYESISRGSDEDTPEKRAFFIRETKKFQTQWNRILSEGDPYYNVNLTRKKEDFSPRVTG